MIQTALENNVDLIIHHHPFLFPKPRYSLKNKTKQKYYHMIKKKPIGLLALHTNFDNSRHGMNYMILQKLKATDIKYYHKSAHIFYGVFPDVNLNQIIAQVKKLFNTKFIQYFGSLSVTFKKIIVVAGAGGSFINKIQYEPHLLFITGEMK